MSSLEISRRSLSSAASHRERQGQRGRIDGRHLLKDCLGVMTLLLASGSGAHALTDPCASTAQQQNSVLNITSPTAQVVVPGVAGSITHICQIQWATGSNPATFSLNEGTGAACATATKSLHASTSLAAYSSATWNQAGVGAATVAQTAVAGDDICVTATRPAAGPLVLLAVTAQQQVVSQPPAPTPKVNEVFNPPNGTASQTGTTGLTTPDGLFKVDGTWTGTGGNTIVPSLAVFTRADPSGVNDPAAGFLSLATTPSKQAGEIISNALPGYGYGYYEVRMIVDPQKVSGGVASFFWMQAGGTLNARTYGPQEFDIEFLLNESWLTSSNAGLVHFTTHPSNATYAQKLNFNPALGYHRYGFLWVPGSLSFTVDGVTVHTVTGSDVASAPANGGWIMANVWTGAATWGGGPPSKTFTADYNWIKFWPGVTSVPTN
ncbi:family 16 glycosylhydrolase [Methylocapsa palsarum]|uniref:Glycosyl hydrolases family 16 n=1 Tax=Methylocapsa palsarum TaxID=1612308 RepID=A0A1I4C8F2_9HYPH|nr:family 16 glycosylhydrolase [Methylocapsa palsarum]SFK77205.1 Glycosyl hydrolases family 16 [Methylocapsa palsarum]